MVSSFNTDVLMAFWVSLSLSLGLAARRGKRFRFAWSSFLVYWPPHPSIKENEEQTPQKARELQAKRQITKWNNKLHAKKTKKVGYKLQAILDKNTNDLMSHCIHSLFSLARVQFANKARSAISSATWWFEAGFRERLHDQRSVYWFIGAWSLCFAAFLLVLSF